MSIGHETARRTDTPGGWVYDDQNNMLLAFDLMLSYGVSPPKLDECIERLEAEGAKAAIDLRERRSRALAAWIADRHKEVKDHIEFIRLWCTFIERDEFLLPLARTGKKFTDNAGKLRKGGPIRRAIARELKNNRALKNRDLWQILANKPPKGWTFNDNNLCKYIEGPKAGDGMGYGRFSEICLEERQKAKFSGVTEPQKPGQ